MADCYKMEKQRQTADLHRKRIVGVDFKLQRCPAQSRFPGTNSRGVQLLLYILTGNK